MSNTATEIDLTEESGDTMENLYIIFFIDGREYGIEIRYLIEIIAFQPITYVPNLPNYVKGVINLRGKIIPVIDVRLRFGLPAIEYTEFTCILIMSFNNLSAGLIVDGVKEVLKIPSDSIEPSPGFEEADMERFIDSIGKAGDTLKILINLNKFIHEKDVKI
ncbi:MAG TPA: chemotaxis protein CheW [Leptospiraceae bacterium]|nr:chemotaxis protein CheW [Leptospiraceae bacterium]HMW08222.1 chemotaxis protein CheW [Leptospiraceae bacterium]HMZ67440.1 chemotaxis protein CheW [Leptospiraceae bacterium]HNA09112.1 chemotaxis protein CheW [Leptospiraceae bacterium]HNC00820.1 chemotaxis protein CheW [Leptospiraceae bacterium]